ncbi:hypothetical protein ACFY19_21950 [Streptosporangium saharense]|uniref:Uncharacterized protein n=1 Tax=Streptosporangium saharense TaxID=1706840 RepID=A0A7W7QPK8_9ACTN|nr:hypothetical protein [Streptosporangium saharense]MBB4916796.1 hypothetical protein [Streptosporangium saharense]
MAGSDKSPRPTEGAAETKTRIRIRRLDKIEMAGNVASNSSGN